MTNELAKIDPREYGLEKKQVISIEQAFAPKIAERDGYVKVYEQLITKEITAATCKEAKELRNKLVKVRTGIAEVHKTQKAYFLAAGRYVDEWKKKETLPIEQMEENLTDIELYFVRLEKERVAKLAAEREAEIRQYSDVIPYGTWNMELSVYTNYLTGLKVAQEARIRAEQEAEAERLRLIEVEKLNTERKNKTIRLVGFIDNYENLSFGEMSEDDFMSLVNVAIKKRTEHEAEQERIRIENLRLKAEAEEKEKALAAERTKVEAERKAAEEKARIEAEKAAAALAAERKAQEELLAKERAEADRKLKEQQEQAKKEAEKAAAEKAKLDAIIKAAADKAESDRKEKEAAELAAKLEAEKLAKAPRKQKLTVWVDSFAIPEFADDEVAAEITATFMKFKNWAKGQVEKL